MGRISVVTLRRRVRREARWCGFRQPAHGAGHAAIAAEEVIQLLPRRRLVDTAVVRVVSSGPRGLDLR